MNDEFASINITNGKVFFVRLFIAFIPRIAAPKAKTVMGCGHYVFAPVWTQAPVSDSTVGPDHRHAHFCLVECC